MDHKIYVNDEGIDKVLTSLRSILNRLERMVDGQKNINSNMQKTWRGTTGEASYDALKKHEDKYSVYIDGLEKRIKFLEAIKNAYFELDNNINKKLEENSETEV